MKIKPVNVPAFSQRAPIDIAVHIALTMFAMVPMLGRHAAQLKMPRPAACGLDNVAAAIGEERDPIEVVIEPYLIQQGHLQRTPRGRIATPAAYLHLGVTPPKVADGDLFEGSGTGRGLCLAKAQRRDRQTG